MPRVRILTDSTSDLPAGFASALNITVVPAYVQVGGRSLRDGEEIFRTEFYRLLPDLAEMPTTSVAPAGEFAEAFRSLVGVADSVIAIMVAQTLSGMLNAARLGSEGVSGLDVHLVDSGQLTMGLGWQVIAAAEAAAAGKDVSEILATVNSMQPRIRVLAVLDTMENLYRSGRVDWARAMAARLLRVKPLIEFRRGEAVLVGRVRTRQRAIERLLEMIDSLGPLERLAVLHTAAPDFAEFQAQVTTRFPAAEVVASEVCPAIGTHVGPRALGIAAVCAV